MKQTTATTGMIVGCVLLLLSVNGVSAQDWPQWRGPNRDNKITGFTEPKTWPKELKHQWKVKVGEADASPVLAGDKVYAFGRQGGDEVIVCLNAENGKEVWSDKYAAPAARVPRGGHTGPRSSPAVADGKVCTLGVSGILSCLDAASGKMVWRKDTKGYPQFFTASSPIIQDGKCIAQIGGRSGEVVAYDLTSGEEKWKWSGDGTAYGSPVLMTVDKTKMIVTPTNSSLVGINADDGKQLWKVAFSSRYNSATPIVDGDKVIYSAPGGGFGGGGGRGGGTVAYKVEKKGDAFEANQLWKKNDAAGIYNTPVLKDGLLFGLVGGNNAPAYLFCMNAETGDTLWTDKTRRGECANVLDAGSVLLGLSSDSQLLAFKPSKKEYEEVAKYKVADSEIWSAPIISGKRIFVKDKDSVTLWTLEETP
jgi:outer membrane protein assembly factor BamB